MTSCVGMSRLQTATTVNKRALKKVRHVATGVYNHAPIFSAVRTHSYKHPKIAPKGSFVIQLCQRRIHVCGIEARIGVRSVVQRGCDQGVAAPKRGMNYIPFSVELTIDKDGIWQRREKESQPVSCCHSSSLRLVQCLASGKLPCIPHVGWQWGPAVKHIADTPILPLG